MKLQTHITVQFVLLAIIPMVVMMRVVFFNEQRQLVLNSIDHLTSVVEVQESRLTETLEGMITSVQLIGSRTQMRLSFQSYLETGDQAELQRVLNIIQDAVNSTPHVTSVSLLDTQGRYIVTTQEALTVDQQPDIIGLTTYTFGDFYVNENDVPLATIAGPIAIDGIVIGFLEVLMDARELLAITEDRSGLGKSGELVLGFMNETEGVTFVSALRYETYPPFSHSIDGENEELPMYQAVRGREVVMTDSDVADYRGQAVVAVTRYLEEVGWGLVAKQDQEEILAPVYALQTMMNGIFLLSLALIVVVTLVVTHTILRPVEALTRVANAYRKGNTKARVQVETDNEFAKLADTVNKLIEEVDRTQGKLTEKVADRTEALEQKVHELERLNKVMLNRETKMIELKKKIRALEKQQPNTPPKSTQTPL